jgi:integrase
MACTFIVHLFQQTRYAMPKITGPYWVWKRPKTKKFQITLYPASGLPLEVCKNWQRKSFSRLPLELAAFREPKTKAEAKTGVLTLIEFLKNQLESPQNEPHASSRRTSVKIAGESPAVGKWLEKFTSLDDNPRAARLMAEGSPYSPDTLALYKMNFHCHLKNDPFMAMNMDEIEQSHSLAFIARIGNQQTKAGRNMAGTRTFEIVINFVRMAFKEYEEEHPDWRNPFRRIKAPRRKTEERRDAIEKEEIVKLFVPGVIADPLEKAVCMAMFWAGLRRSEIWGLKAEDLDWKTPKIRIDHAWKRLASKERKLGDPKWHKHRTTPFPVDLQNAIKELWAVNGKHEFVFARKDGSQPGPDWIRDHLPTWFERAGIESNGRKIVPPSARHSIASALEARGVPLRYIGDMLGHSSLKTTKGYLHTVSGAINDMGAKIDGMAKQIKKKEEIYP